MNSVTNVVAHVKTMDAAQRINRQLQERDADRMRRLAQMPDLACEDETFTEWRTRTQPKRFPGAPADWPSVEEVEAIEERLLGEMYGYA